MNSIDLPNHSSYHISRRNFLKLGALGLASLLVPARKLPFTKAHENYAAIFDVLFPGAISSLWKPGVELDPWVSGEQQGRVVDPSLVVYDKPFFKANKVKLIWKDSVVGIDAVTLSDDESSHNRVWYHATGLGYVHSGSIQPVVTVLNEPSSNLPEGGRLAEVTVPFTDACWAPQPNQPVAYRYYFATTHWVIELTYDQEGSPWYGILDDKWEMILYVPARHLRLIPNEELTPLSPEVPSSRKQLEVRLPDQVLIAYEEDRPVFMARVATGAKFRDGDYSTQTGHFITFHKRPSRHMAAGNLAYNGYDLPGVPWICYFTESGISFHGTYWHNNYGRPRSHGCINLTPLAARWIYRWTIPVVPTHEQMAYEDYGTGVDIIS